MNITSNYRVIANGFGRLEAPIPIDGNSMLVSDVTLGGVYKVNLQTGQQDTFVPHRKGIGGLCLHEQGVVITGRNVSLRTAQGESIILLEPDLARGVTGFNDMTVDALGRIYVGALCFKVAEGWDTAKPGLLYRIDLNGEVSVIDDDLLLPNGMAFAADDSRLYVSDSLRKIVWQYPVKSNGELAGRQFFANIPEGMADGVTVAKDGSVLIAAAYAGAVYWFEKDGNLREKMEFPWPVVTSVCFDSGSSEKILVTTGPEDAPPALGGGVILEMPLRASGATRYTAKVKLPSQVRT